MSKCQRCGKKGQDRRTLWMACFYKMSELNIPFNEDGIIGVCISEKVLDKCIKTKEPISIGVGEEMVNLTPGEVSYEGPLTPIQFFTLRVCKTCRAEWLNAIEEWFHAETEGDDDAL